MDSVEHSSLLPLPKGNLRVLNKINELDSDWDEPVIVPSDFKYNMLLEYLSSELYDIVRHNSGGFDREETERLNASAREEIVRLARVIASKYGYENIKYIFLSYLIETNAYTFFSDVPKLDTIEGWCSKNMKLCKPPIACTNIRKRKIKILGYTFPQADDNYSVVPCFITDSDSRDLAWLPLLCLCYKHPNIKGSFNELCLEIDKRAATDEQWLKMTIEELNGRYIKPLRIEEDLCFEFCGKIYPYLSFDIIS